MNGLNNPGVALLNDGTSIQVANTSAFQRAAEKEALEDQKHRETELAQQMQNAFNDLIDDDDRDDTLDSVNYLSNCSEHPGGSPLPLPIVPNPSKGQRFLDGIKSMQNGGAGGFIGDGLHVQEASHWFKDSGILIRKISTGLASVLKFAELGTVMNTAIKYGFADLFF
ncbi:uncharacterized protein LOC129747484 [Uranotaenia lowii]|uniref:uncharacterized protein LOC129747484 n=1 Tax=Uranotaenia lowii TaxID=190385 RepID=UPI0024797AD6|nr:uncharacterized protein LOC129747484 [Uranotaenia lowii]XP_055597708.1 uncharacterized protein LOC129747484 [Uranotaenia lowii]